MLRSLSHTRDARLAYRVASIILFTLLTVVAARVTIPMQPIPFTLQPLAVLLAGMILGGRDGALSQLAYLALIAINLPVDANMLGAAAFLSPTAGYLFGFVAAAFVAGWLVERSAGSSVGHIWRRWLAGVAGVAVIYLLGSVMLQARLALAWDAVWALGVAPFIVPDLAKAMIAAALVEGGRRLVGRVI